MIIANYIFCFIELYTLFYLLKNVGRLRVNTYTLYILLLSVALINTILSRALPESIATPLIICNSIILVLISFKTKYGVLIAYTLTFSIIVGIVSILSVNVFAILFKTTAEHLFSNSTIFIFGGLINKIIVFVLVIIYLKYIKIDEYKNSNFLLLFTILSLLILISNLVIFSFTFETQNNSNRQFMLLLSLLFTTLYFVVMFMFFKYSQISNENMKLSTLSTLNSLFEEYKGSIEENRNNLQKIQHDYKSNLQLLINLIDSGNHTESSKLVKSLKEQYSTIQNRTWCNNVVLDCIINNQINRYPSIHFELPITSNLSLLNELDTCILFTNLLANATRAATVTEVKNIQLFIHENENFYIIEVSNSILNDSIDINKTTKVDSKKHGYGIQNINQIIKKYKGNSDITIQNKVFSFKILLPKVV